jgi:hypothetical protein
MYRVVDRRGGGELRVYAEGQFHEWWSICWPSSTRSPRVGSRSYIERLWRSLP